MYEENTMLIKRYTVMKTLLALSVFMSCGLLQGLSYCSTCDKVDCRYRSDCGFSCECVKLNGNYEGQCVEK